MSRYLAFVTALLTLLACIAHPANRLQASLSSSSRLGNQLSVKQAFTFTIPPPPPEPGLTMDYCTLQVPAPKCVPPRTCSGPSTDGGGITLMRCIPPTLQTCSTSEECVINEVCAINNTRPSSDSPASGGAFVFVPVPTPVCLSARFVRDSGPRYTISREDDSGLTWDQCMTTTQCAGDRECRHLGTQCNSEHRRCLCWPSKIMTCASSAECVDGETCITDKDDFLPICRSTAYFRKFNLSFVEWDAANPTPFPSPSPSASVTPTPSPAPSPTAPPVCVSAEHLDYLHPHQLVFDNHVAAHVLCDAFNSCATPGHMVLLNGRFMMMKSYCETVHCVRRVVMVNSPRFRRGLLIASRTEGLSFTALAARYVTTFEELILGLAARVAV